MSISLDNHAQVATLNSQSYTNSGSYMVVFAEGSQNNTDNVSAITYGGKSLTLVDKITTGAAGSAYQYSWVLANPPTGANTFTTTGTTSNAYVVTYNGTQGSTTPDAHTTVNNGNSSVTSISIATTTVADNCWVVAHFRAEGGSATFSAGANTTFRDNVTSGASADTNGVVHPAGAVTQSVTFSATTFTSALSISIAPASASGGAFLFNVI